MPNSAPRTCPPTRPLHATTVATSCHHAKSTQPPARRDDGGIGQTAIGGYIHAKTSSATPSTSLTTRPV